MYKNLLQQQKKTNTGIQNTYVRWQNPDTGKFQLFIKYVEMNKAQLTVDKFRSLYLRHI